MLEHMCYDLWLNVLFPVQVLSTSIRLVELVSPDMDSCKLRSCAAMDEFTSKYVKLMIGIELMYDEIDIYMFPDLNTMSAVPVILLWASISRSPLK
jgi:hypothetical protein